MNVQIVPHPLSGKISAVGSKSFAHRALIASAFLKSEPTDIYGITVSQDVLATVDCLRALGATVEVGDVFHVVPATHVPACAVLNCRESGSTLRFLLPVVAALGVSATFCGSSRLFQRPTQSLVETLQKGGVNVDGRKLSGKLCAGDFEVESGVSSQYVSGMLLALSMLRGESRLFLKGNVVSKQYVDVTLEVLKSFGVEVERTEFGFSVKGGEKHISPRSYTVEGDWSNAAFMLVAGALGDVTVCGLNPCSCQGDREIKSVLELCGANVQAEENCIRVQKGKLNAFKVDARHIPDAVPALAVLAAFCKGTTEICGVERLRDKESDRLTNVLKTLREASVGAVFEGGALKITGGVPQGAIFDADNDHRMAMSQTILALYAKGNSKIIGAECVDKSYPEFFRDVQKLGGDNCVLLERK